MATSPWSQTALLTVATEGFVPGTFVTVGTFLEHHPGFDGDIVVVAEELSDLSRDVLAGLYSRLRFEPPSPQLAARAAKLCEARPELLPRRANFYVLEAFRPHGYRELLALDSDLLFRGSVTPLLDVDSELVCCPDQFALRGVRRDATTYQPAEDHPSSERSAATIGDTFNSGVLLLRGGLMRQGVYDELVRMVDPATWRGVKAVNTDQLVLNRYFAGRQTLASSTYNYLVTSAADIRAHEGIAMDAAKVLHFKLPIKPWQTEAMLRWARPNPSHPLPPRYKAWYDAYLRCLGAANLRRRTRRPLGRVPKASPKRPGRQAPSRSPAPPGQGVCLAIATSESLVPATLVTLDSFLKHHPRFAGEIVVIDDDLSDASRQALAGVGPVRFEPVLDELRERLAQLGQDVPRLRHKLAHFHSIGAFRLTGYRKLLVCDSDLLFRAPIDELFATSDALIACPDSPTLRGLARDAKTFRTVAAATAAPADILQDTFNSGLLVVDGSEFPAAYHSLLAMLNAETWRGTEVALTDQLLLNRHFAGRQRLASSAYNYLVSYAPHIRAREGIGLGDAKVLHYLAPYKPWQSQRMLRWAASGSTRGLLPGYQLWYDAYVDCLARLGMRAAVRGATRHAVGATG